MHIQSWLGKTPIPIVKIVLGKIENPQISGFFSSEAFVWIPVKCVCCVQGLSPFSAYSGWWGYHFKQGMQVLLLGWEAYMQQMCSRNQWDIVDHCHFVCWHVCWMTVSKSASRFIRDWFGGHREHSLQRKVKTPFKNLEISYLVILLSNLYRA